VRPGGDEPFEQVLRKVVVDLARRDRRAEVPVATWVVDVDIEPVLVGRVLVEPPPRRLMSPITTRGA